MDETGADWMANTLLEGKIKIKRNKTVYNETRVRRTFTLKTSFAITIVSIKFTIVV